MVTKKIDGLPSQTLETTKRADLEAPLRLGVSTVAMQREVRATCTWNCHQNIHFAFRERQADRWTLDTITQIHLSVRVRQKVVVFSHHLTWLLH